MIWKCHASVSTNFWNRLFSRDFVFLSSLFVKTFFEARDADDMQQTRKVMKVKGGCRFWRTWPSPSSR
eukprot:UN24570